MALKNVPGYSMMRLGRGRLACWWRRWWKRNVNLKRTKILLWKCPKLIQRIQHKKTPKINHHREFAQLRMFIFKSPSKIDWNLKLTVTLNVNRKSGNRKFIHLFDVRTLCTWGYARSCKWNSNLCGINWKKKVEDDFDIFRNCNANSSICKLFTIINRFQGHRNAY